MFVQKISGTLENGTRGTSYLKEERPSDTIDNFVWDNYWSQVRLLQWSDRFQGQCTSNGQNLSTRSDGELSLHIKLACSCDISTVNKKQIYLSNQDVEEAIHTSGIMFLRIWLWFKRNIWYKFVVYSVLQSQAHRTILQSYTWQLKDLHSDWKVCSTVGLRRHKLSVVARQAPTPGHPFYNYSEKPDPHIAERGFTYYLRMISSKLLWDKSERYTILHSYSLQC